LAVLDEGFAVRISAWPQLTAELLERAVRRSRSLAAQAAIGHVVGVEQRLEALFWCLAERWGAVAREGVTLPLPLTHQALADMVGAQRPSVTSALGKLARAGTLTRLDGTWTLHGNAPEPGGACPLPARQKGR
jgi:CRP/FNR family cyclic AMP-dependent transcriptional regulator